MTETLNQKTTRVNRWFYLVPVLIIALGLFSWFVGQNDPVSSYHALLFLIDRDPWYIGLVILDAIALVLLCIGVVKQNTLTEESKWPYVVTFVGCFAALAILFYTRNAAGHDINTSFWYNQFAKLKGW